tara:strand:- start:2429 stop:3283 length:855 start_codon:yes stop_codon:yes gene_type:complete
MNRVAFLNNKFVKFNSAKIHIEDRGLQFSDSVYEVVMIFNSQIIDFEFHIKRLRYSLKELSINYVVNKKFLKEIFAKLLKKNSIKNGIIYLQITRGIQSREHAFKRKLKPTVISYTQKKKFNLPNKNYKGYKAVLFPDIRWARRDIKSTSLLPNVLASTYAAKKFSYEAIFIHNQKITEASHSNVWIIKNKKIFTHPSNQDILKGITRTVLVNIIKKNNFILKENFFSLNILLNADEVFITSSGSLITPIVKIENKKIGKGKIGTITKLLAIQLMQFYKNQYKS